MKFKNKAQILNGIRIFTLLKISSIIKELTPDKTLFYLLTLYLVVDIFYQLNKERSIKLEQCDEILSILEDKSVTNVDIVKERMFESDN